MFYFQLPFTRHLQDNGHCIWAINKAMLYCQFYYKALKCTNFFSNFFSQNRIYLLFEAFGRKIFLICLNPRFSMPSAQSRAWRFARPSFRESGAAVAKDVYPGTKHSGTSVCSVFARENGKQNWSFQYILGLESPSFFFKNQLFFITGVRVKFIRFERLRSKLQQLWNHCLELWKQFAIVRERPHCGRTACIRMES